MPSTSGDRPAGRKHRALLSERLDMRPRPAPALSGREELRVREDAQSAAQSLWALGPSRRACFAVADHAPSACSSPRWLWGRRPPLLAELGLFQGGHSGSQVGHSSPRYGQQHIRCPFQLSYRVGITSHSGSGCPAQCLPASHQWTL